MTQSIDAFHGRKGRPQVRLAIGVLVFLGGVGMVLYHQRWVRSALQGPTPITQADLQELKDPKQLPNPWVSFDFDEAIDTGFVMEMTKSGNTRQRSKYLLIRVGKRWLLADVPVAFSSNQVVGHLDTWWSPLSKKVIDRVERRFPEHDILPYQLNAENDYQGQCFGMLGVAGAICLVGIAILGYAVSDLRKVKRMAEIAPGQGSLPPLDEKWTEKWQS